MKFLDDNSKKKVRWWNKNYYFIGTVFIVLINIFIFAFVNGWQNSAFPVPNNDPGTVSSNFYIIPFLRYFFNSFSHVNLQHVLLNMLCFLVVGLYLERKTGSVGIFLLIISSSFFASIAMAARSYATFFTQGFSGVNYFLYAYLIIEYLFSFQKSKRNITSIIFGIIVLALIYLAMCFTGGSSSFGFTWYPYDLIGNRWHYSGFIAGIVFSLTIQFAQLKARKEIA